MAINTNKFAVQQIFTVDSFSLEDGSLNARLEDLKQTNLSNNGEIVYAQGGVGNAKIIGFSHSKSSTLEIQNAVITDGALAIQTGSGLKELTNTNLIPFDEVVVAATANTAVLTHTATGEVGSELGFAYLLSPDGSVSKTFTQVATTPATGQFTYATATKTITFFAGEVPVGSKVLAMYYPNVATAKNIKNATDVFSMNVRLHCRTLFRDTCTGKDYIGVLVIYKAKCSEEWGLELSADGEPAVHSMTFEALKSCESPVLWDIYIYDSSDIKPST